MKLLPQLISFRVATQNVMEDMNEESLPKASFCTDHFRRRSIFSSTITATGTNASSLAEFGRLCTPLIPFGGDDNVGERSLNVEVEEWRHSALHFTRAASEQNRPGDGARGCGERAVPLRRHRVPHRNAFVLLSRTTN